MEEDEDQCLLSSLGVTSANPADLEKTILDAATKKLDNNEGETVEEQSVQDEGSNLLASSQNELLNKLRAVKFEIDAVASTVEPVDEIAAENGVQKDDESDVHGLHSGSVFQQALATDRLRSLKKRKIQIEKELTGLHGASGSADHDNLLRDLVKDEPSLKRKIKEIRKPSKREGKKVKVVSFHKDTDFDAVFDAASAGFVETERDEFDGVLEDGRRILTPSSCEEEELDDFGDPDDDKTSFVQLEGGLNIPECIFCKLFEYQRIGVNWLWELHCQRAGGIIGDEMGLGKTVQVLSFLGSLHSSKMYKPSIVICPVTLLHQWRREARKWYPDFHVEILHDSAQESRNGKGQGKASESNYDSECSVDSDHEQESKNTKKWDSLINRVLILSQGFSSPHMSS